MACAAFHACHGHVRKAARSLAVLCGILAGCGDGESHPPTTVRLPGVNERDSSTLETAVRCKVEPLLEAHKDCTRDVDCELLAYRDGCCDPKRVVGIARAGAEDVRACADGAPAVCACTPLPSRAEDGRVAEVDGVGVMAVCDKGRCASRVSTRRCGVSLECAAHELCVSYENVPGQRGDPSSGDNALLSFVCVANPCTTALACECASSACDARADVPRKCELELATESDVICTAYRD